MLQAITITTCATGTADPSDNALAMPGEEEDDDDKREQAAEVAAVVPQVPQMLVQSLLRLVHQEKPHLIILII